METQSTPLRSSNETPLVCRAAALMAVLVVLDQITKAVIERNADNLPASVVPGFFDIVSVSNTGAAWGMLQEHKWLLLGVAMVFLVAIVLRLKHLTEGWPERYYSMGMIASGIIGNSIDRIWRGAVVDFLDFHVAGHHWPAFNVADSAICVGVGIYLVSSFKRSVRIAGKESSE